MKEPWGSHGFCPGDPMEVHPENFRCIVAALRAPGWFRHYQGLKRLASSGRAFFGNIWKFNGRVMKRKGDEKVGECTHTIYHHVLGSCMVMMV